MSSPPIQSTTDYKFSHALTGPYLPPPGKAPGWPFAGIGHWMIDVNAASENWIRGLREWRQLQRDDDAHTAAAVAFRNRHRAVAHERHAALAEIAMDRPEGT